MAYYGSDRCRDCSGEDCVCCEVYLEDRASSLAAYEYEPDYDDLADDYDENRDDDYEDDGQPDEAQEWDDFYGGDDWDQGQYDE